MFMFMNYPPSIKLFPNTTSMVEHPVLEPIDILIINIIYGGSLIRIEVKRGTGLCRVYLGAGGGGKVNMEQRHIVVSLHYSKEMKGGGGKNIFFKDTAEILWGTSCLKYTEIISCLLFINFSSL